MRRDILSAYAASISRVMSWVIVSAIVYRRSHEAFAMLALVRGTIGILNYAALGILPAMIRAFTQQPPINSKPSMKTHPPGTTAEGPIPLSYFTPPTSRQKSTLNYFQSVFAAGQLMAVSTAGLGALVAVYVAKNVEQIYRIPSSVMTMDASVLVLAMGGGIVLRWLSDPAGAVLQTGGRIALDNWILASAEIAWVFLSEILRTSGEKFLAAPLQSVSLSFLLSSGFLLLVRSYVGCPRFPASVSVFQVSGKFFRPLLTTGLLITMAQLADYLYSPTDYLLINHLLTPLDLTHYAPAVQIDSGLLLLVTALGSVLLPKTALAHAAGDRAIVRTYYLRGTLASAVTLLTASLVIYFASPLIFRLWFGNAMPGTVAILPLVLLNTVIGGSSAVGRAILIGIGKTKPFAISVLIAGLTNVVFSVIFVRYFQMGLNGIILGTIVAVVARCGIWMPWYVLRELDRGETS